MTIIGHYNMPSRLKMWGGVYDTNVTVQRVNVCVNQTPRDKSTVAVDTAKGSVTVFEEIADLFHQVQFTEEHD